MKQFLEKSSVLLLHDIDGKTGKEWDVVLIESGLSLNNRFYSNEVLERSVSLFEGVKCCAFLEGNELNHRNQNNARRNPSGPSRNTVGWFENVRFEEFQRPDGTKGHGIIARFHILPSQTWLMEDLKDSFSHGKSDLLGFSIDAHGESRGGMINGKEALIVEKITQVESTDVVTSPAAGGGVLRIAASEEKGNQGMKNIKKFAEKLGIKQKEGESDEDFTSRVLEAKVPLKEENPLGDFIRKISEEKGISTTVLAETADLDKGQLALIMSGKIKRPPDARLKKMAASLGVSFEELKNKIPESVKEVDGAFITDHETEFEMKTKEEIKEAEKKLAEDQKASRIKDGELLVRECLIGSDLPEKAKEKITEKFKDKEDVTEDQIKEAIKSEKEYIASFKEGTGKVNGLGDAHDDNADDATRIKVSESQNEKFGKAWDGFYEGENIDGVPKFHNLNEAWRAYNENNKNAHGSREFVSLNIFECMHRSFPKKIMYDFGDPYVQHAQKLKESWDRGSSDCLQEATITSDFAVGFGQAMFRRLQKEYTQDPRNDWRQIISGIENLQDATNTFSIVRTGETKELPVVGQGAPYQELHPDRAEEVEVIQPSKRGGLEVVTWEDVLADNIGIVKKIPRNLARASNLTIHKLVWDQIELNPNMQDGFALFDDTNHSNDLSGAGALSYANSVLSIVKLRNQLAFESGEKLGLMPAWLFTSVDQEAKGEEIIGSDRKETSSEDATIDNVLKKKFLMRALGTIGLGRTSGTKNFWYIAASGKDADTIAVGFLGGRDRPDIFVQGVDTPTAGSMFDADKITYKIRLVVGARVVDHRWIQRSANV